ncbi:jg13753 [Pararge aegeria aegeria]|uniref:Jg13753 protein n=1 Tax=Pararge aegeria aegeria TaxID=348720 RepID=A0A8S4QQ58_9NEOP|nr:jg13753 [Pararge aegeria aegeria]
MSKQENEDERIRRVLMESDSEEVRDPTMYSKSQGTLKLICAFDQWYAPHKCHHRTHLFPLPVLFLFILLPYFHDVLVEVSLSVAHLFDALETLVPPELAGEIGE